jgi:hypothetical protein
MLLHYDDYEEENNTVTIDKPPDPTTENTTNNQPEHHLSLNAMKGDSNMGVLRFPGSIEHIKVQVLIDGGSLDNFVQPRIAKFPKTPVEPGHVFRPSATQFHHFKRLHNTDAIAECFTIQWLKNHTS